MISSTGNHDGTSHCPLSDTSLWLPQEVTLQVTPAQFAALAVDLSCRIALTVRPMPRGYVGSAGQP